MLSLTSTIPSGVADSYGESVGAEVWCEGMTHHAALMVRCGSSTVEAFDRFHLGCRRGYGAGAANWGKLNEHVADSRTRMLSRLTDVVSVSQGRSLCGLHESEL
ncbi:hypothetical protein B296_00002603 [Ensete ventricosum]|uniref:Uncharacterized protein n=1 Tax=Ensete ventricosum TaxID=4639 RepID=A0A426ZQV7_ENSVE|nr:hypothetical protein B296_00002603 [Ensete ventricosum]